MPANSSQHVTSASLRKPHDSQKGLGSDLSITCFARIGTPSKVSQPERLLLKGLNAETIAKISFHPPPWTTNPGYSSLLVDAGDEDSRSGIFSLSFSMYNQSIYPEDWEEMWFFTYGRVHPYALTWKIEPDPPVDDSGTLQDFTAPLLIIRDQGIQPIYPRSIGAISDFPTISPIASFTGPILGSGQTLMKNDHLSALDDTQRKCCGFVQLSSFITPGTTSNSPGKGFHPFQVFLIFPIHAKPWTTLGKWMIEKEDTLFQKKTHITCTGKIAGFLSHDLMLHPPPLQQDYVFVIVPDTWTFHNKGQQDSPSMQTPATTPSKRASAFSRSQFMSPSKRPALHNRAGFGKAIASLSDPPSQEIDPDLTEASSDLPVQNSSSPPLTELTLVAVTSPSSEPSDNSTALDCTPTVRPSRNRHLPKKYHQIIDHYPLNTPSNARSGNSLDSPQYTTTVPPYQQPLDPEVLLAQAVSAYKNKKVASIRKAARCYGVNRCTLFRRLRGIPAKRDCVPTSQKFTAAEESGLVAFLTDLHNRGFPPTTSGLAAMANILLAQRGDDPVGKNWALGFIKRHSELDSTFLPKADCQNPESEDPLVLENWFTLLTDTVTKYSVMEADVYSFDQASFKIGITTKPHVVTSTSRSNSQKKTHPGNKEWVSIAQGINSQGWALPPLLILGEKSHDQSWYNTNQLPHDWLVAFSDNGWATKELYYQWICHFDTNTRLRTFGQYRLLILDAHSHCISMEFQQYCNLNNILTLCVPSLVSQLLQPLELGCLDPLKTAYGRIIDRIGGQRPHRITKLDFLTVFKEIYQNSFTRENILTGFREAGLAPYNPRRVLQKRPSRKNK